MEELPSVDPSIDYRKILPIQQKRIITFINHFIIDTVMFLNKFAQSCESRLMDFEYKVQKVEATLLILESQLSSVPDLEDVDLKKQQVKVEDSRQEQSEVELPEVPSSEDRVQEVQVEEEQTDKGKVAEDPRYTRFFKMLQVGVPLAAVQHKMELEGFDSSILTNPNAS